MEQTPQTDTSTWDTAINIAIQWWISRITGDVPRMDNGDGWASAMLTVIAASKPRNVTTEQIETFTAYLTQRIKNAWTWECGRWPDRPPSTILSTDYAPKGMLDDALELANIRAPLPIKTQMYISPEKVHVAEGYTARPVYLLGSE